MPGLYLSDIWYNTMMIVGDPLGLIADSQHVTGQPYALSMSVGQNWALATDPMTQAGVQYKLDDPVTSWSAKAASTTGRHVWSVPFSKELYDQSMIEGSLLGQGWLQWSTLVLPGTGASEGHYFGRADYHDRNDTTDLTHAVRFNEWSGDLLMMKLQTIGILTAGSLAGFYGGRYLYRKYGG
jgi:hypothetical protein